jgi:hypothetical protein
VLFVVVGGLLVAAALVLYGLIRGGDNSHAEWLALSDALRKRREPLSLAEMKPADVPAAQNFFAAEVFNGLADDAPASTLLQRATDPGGGLSVADLLTQAQKGGGSSLDAIATAMQGAGFVSKRTDYLLAGDRVRAGMRKLGLDFDALREAADRPAARFPLDYDKPFPALPHLHRLEALGDWLAIHAIAQLSTGDSENAAVDLLLIARLADALATEPFLPSQRTRRTLLGLFAGCVRVGIGWDAWSDDQLARFGETLSRAQLLGDFAWAVRGERAQLNTAVSTALSGRKPEASDTLRAWLGEDLTTLNARRLRARQIAVNAAVQQFLDALLAEPLQPAALSPSADRSLPENVRERLYALAEEARIFAQVQTLLAQTEIACALERHRLARRAYPDTLDALVPDWIAALPADPIGGQNFDYKRPPEGDGFTLTGAGWPGTPAWKWTR